jgi:hypothetical protein
LESELAAPDRAEVGRAGSARPVGFVVLRGEVVRGLAREERLAAAADQFADRRAFIDARDADLEDFPAGPRAAIPAST